MKENTIENYRDYDMESNLPSIPDVWRASTTEKKKKISKMRSINELVLGLFMSQRKILRIGTYKVSKVAKKKKGL